MVTTASTSRGLDLIWQALETVCDPEIPALTVIELGIIADAWIDNGRVTIQMCPTFSGCPALDIMQSQIKAAVQGAGFDDVTVAVVFDPPWTSDRITPEGLRKLKQFGLAPPVRCSGVVREDMLHNVACPFCDSKNTTLESIFGPTLCRAIHYCNNCLQSFEQFKPV
ncbi:MAG TPA: 1,2-phenylacetyl-CoA epoxidase subunit PaaD [Phycisphaerae bacterium]|nr:1,2-phenylacetyl-CoA epoxidase subunit PaaD [Phycisphaerae bacterium]